MFCSNCGKQIPDGSQFCPECGAKQDIDSSAPLLKNPKLNKNYRTTVGTGNDIHIMDYAEWIRFGALMVIILGMLLPVVKVIGIGGPRVEHVSDFEPSNAYDMSLITYLTLTVFSATVAVVFQYLSTLKKYSDYAAIAAFILGLIYYINIYDKLDRLGYSWEIKEIGSGTIFIVIGCVILLVFGILDLRQNKTLNH